MANMQNILCSTIIEWESNKRYILVYLCQYNQFRVKGEGGKDNWPVRQIFRGGNSLKANPNKSLVFL